MTKIKIAIICLTVFALGFFIGMDWPYLLPPDDFGEYTSDGEYRFVITEDETRLCRQVCILDNDGREVYHTSGYMNLGWHYGRYDLDVYWANDTYDLFVKDGRGTIDVFQHIGSAWQGPYSIQKTEDAEYALTAPPYDYDAADSTYDALPMPYAKSNIPDEILSAFAS